MIQGSFSLLYLACLGQMIFVLGALSMKEWRSLDLRSESAIYLSELTMMLGVVSKDYT